MIEKEFHLPAYVRRVLFPDASLITFTGETRGESIHGWMKGKAGNTATGARGPGLCSERDGSQLLPKAAQSSRLSSSPGAVPGRIAQ